MVGSPAVFQSITFLGMKRKLAEQMVVVELVEFVELVDLVVEFDLKCRTLHQRRERLMVEARLKLLLEVGLILDLKLPFVGLKVEVLELREVLKLGLLYLD